MVAPPTKPITATTIVSDILSAALIFIVGNIAVAATKAVEFLKTDDGLSLF
jgi:hypothetical protein